MSDIKAVCDSCGAKYRLPLEAAGRSARCKKCGNKFSVPQPKAKSLEDSILDWLAEPEGEEDTAVEQPRVINIPKDAAETDEQRKARSGVIRMKSPATPGH